MALCCFLSFFFILYLFFLWYLGIPIFDFRFATLFNLLLPLFLFICWIFILLIDCRCFAFSTTTMDSTNTCFIAFVGLSKLGVLNLLFYFISPWPMSACESVLSLCSVIPPTIWVLFSCSLIWGFGDFDGDDSLFFVLC